jgi:hypothetical protein
MVSVSLLNSAFQLSEIIEGLKELQRGIDLAQVELVTNPAGLDTGPLADKGLALLQAVKMIENLSPEDESTRELVNAITSTARRLREAVMLVSHQIAALDRAGFLMAQVSLREQAIEELLTEAADEAAMVREMTASEFEDAA